MNFNADREWPEDAETAEQTVSQESRRHGDETEQPASRATSPQRGLRSARIAREHKPSRPPVRVRVQFPGRASSPYRLRCSASPCEPVSSGPSDDSSLMSVPTRNDPAKQVAPAPQAPQGAGMSDYLKEAFLFRWNLLFLLGGTAAAALTPLAPVLLPLVAAGELAYLTGLVSVPRFRAAIDAKVHAAGKAAGAGAGVPPPPPVSVVSMLGGLPTEARTRFERLHARCLEMRGIAAGVRGAAGDQNSSVEEH